MHERKERERATRHTQREKEVLSFGRALVAKKKRERERASPVYFVFSCTMKILTHTHITFYITHRKSTKIEKSSYPK